MNVAIPTLGAEFGASISTIQWVLTGYMLAFGIAWGLCDALTTRAHIRVDVLVSKCEQTLKKTGRKALCVGGGVAANGRLHAIGVHVRGVRAQEHALARLLATALQRTPRSPLRSRRTCRRRIRIPARSSMCPFHQALHVSRDDVHLVTLTGPGGTGKSRLALELAWDAVERFDDGVFLVRLGQISDAELVPSAIAGALGVREPAVEVETCAGLDRPAAGKLQMVVADGVHCRGASS